MQTETVNKSRRRVERISLTIPVRVDCQESKIVSWSEITRFHSISAIGADLSLTRKVMVGQLLLLTSSFPSKLRRFDYSETQYRVWTLVRHCKLIEASGSSKESFLVGVAFIGQYPPQSYRKSPDKRYLLSNFNQAGFCEISEIATEIEPQPAETDSIIERREERYSIPFEVFVEILDENQNSIDHELTVTENVSHHGSAIRTILDAKIGKYVRISLVGYDISILAIVRNCYADEDGIQRLHLEFIDGQFPLDGIE